MNFEKSGEVSASAPVKTAPMSRVWQLKALKGEALSEIGNSGGIVDQTNLEHWLSRLAQETNLSPVTIKVCMQRGMVSLDSIYEFLNPKLEALTDPYLIADMSVAIDRLVVARAQSQKIRVFGDYDVDGTTGSALLGWVFREFGYSADIRQPDRFKDGYGLNVQAVEQAVADGIQLLITVDCGISSFAALDRAHELELDVIVVDHHQLDAIKGLPKALAVVNPQRPDCQSGLKQLCGCGLAFYLARALRSKGRELQWWSFGKEPNLKRHLDLVVMATAADLVPLTGDNHILVRHGLEVLKRSTKPGVMALLTSAGLLARELSPGALGFVLGPRINASGRMGSANHALELLLTEDSVQAKVLADQLEQMNKDRADIQNKIWDQVRLKVETGIAEGKFKHGILVADASWHEGVVGIVASRVTEFFRKPAAILALREDHAKGSVRSYAGKDVLAALRKCAEPIEGVGSLLLGFGGHKHAAGLTVSLDLVDQAALAFDQALGELPEDESTKPLYLEGDCEIKDLDLKTLQELENLGPFGPGNAEPVFRFRASIQNHQVLKGRHLKMWLKAPLGGPAIEAIWFNAAENEAFMERISVASSTAQALVEECEWAAVPELNRFRGQVKPNLRVRDQRWV